MGKKFEAAIVGASENAGYRKGDDTKITNLSFLEKKLIMNRNSSNSGSLISKPIIYYLSQGNLSGIIYKFIIYRQYICKCLKLDPD